LGLHDTGAEHHNKKLKHSDDMLVLIFLIMIPVIAALAQVSISMEALFRAFLWMLLGGILLAILFLGYVVVSWPKPRKVQSMRAVAFKPELLPKLPLDVIVIGSGSGGSTCSNLLAQSGQRVLVLEQHPTVRMEACCVNSRRTAKLFQLTFEPIFPH